MREYAVSDQWDDDEIYAYLMDGREMSDEIKSDVYRSLGPDGNPYRKPHQEICERYDGPFDHHAPLPLHGAAGAFIVRSVTYDPTEDDEFEDLTPDAEDTMVEVYRTAEELEAAWNRARRGYD